MKKAAVSVMLTAAMAAGMLAGCGSSSSTASSTASKAGSTVTTTGSEASTDSTTEISSGRVYLLNFKPETDEAWQTLAKKYNELGGNVTVLTAADGQYDTTLQSEMAKSKAPTIFTIGSSDDAKTWSDYIYDLKDTSLYSHLNDKSLAINYDGKIAGVANCYEAYGIIYNKKILESYCKLDGAKISSPDDIKDFDTLKAVADDIQSRVDDVNKQLTKDGVDYQITEAFASAGLDDGSSWRFSGHLANMPLYYEFKDDGLTDLTAGEATIKGTYLDNYRKVWDMYTSDSAADPKTLDSGSYNAEEEFGMGEAVFYQNGDWEYSALTNSDNGYVVSADDMDMMPIYFGVDDENEGLCVGTENYWAVNAKCSEDEIKASLDFLNWAITSDEGRSAMVNDMGLSVPFDTFTGDYASKNPFSAKAAELVNDGKTSVAWAFNATPNVDDWRADVVAALTTYTSDKTDANWEKVKSAFVDGWANQWTLAHEGDTTSAAASTAS